VIDIRSGALGWFVLAMCLGSSLIDSGSTEEPMFLYGVVLAIAVVLV
jgi:hypothetical protein